MPTRPGFACAICKRKPGREQRYYSGFVLRLNHGDGAILKAQHLLQASEGKEARLSVLADEAGMEKCTFLRRFQKATGLTAADSTIGQSGRSSPAPQ